MLDWRLETGIFFLLLVAFLLSLGSFSFELSKEGNLSLVVLIESVDGCFCGGGNKDFLGSWVVFLLLELPLNCDGEMFGLLLVLSGVLEISASNIGVPPSLTLTLNPGSEGSPVTVSGNKMLNLF